MGRRRYSS